VSEKYTSDVPTWATENRSCQVPTAASLPTSSVASVRKEVSRRKPLWLASAAVIVEQLSV
jgi:hypothetical protein